MYSSLNSMIESRKITFDAMYEESKFMDLQVSFDYGLTENLSDVEDLINDPEISGGISKIEYKISGGISKIEYRLIYDVFLNQTTDDGVKTTKGIVMGHQVFTIDDERRDLDVNIPLYYVDDPPVFSSSDANECFLERKFARYYDLGEGDQITIVKGQHNVELDILEHANIPEYFMVVTGGGFIPLERSLGILILPLETAQKIYLGVEDREPIVNDIVLTLKDPDELDAFTEKITQKFEGVGILVKTTEKEDNPARAMLREDLKGDEDIMASFPVIIFIVAGFGLIMALRRMIQTHKAQIGVFKSLGVPNRVVLTYFGIIGLLIATAGVIFGWLLAIPLDWVWEGLARSLLDTAVFEYQISMEHYVVGGFVAFILCLTCTIIPAWFALRIKPVDAIMQREGISKRSVGGIASRIGHRGKLPVPLKLTLRNMLRKPGRTATTILGVALSLALFLGFMIMMDSMIVLLDNNDTTQWDYEVGMDGFTPIAVSQDWEDENVVEDLHYGIMLPTSFHSGEESVDAIIYSVDDLEAIYNLEFDAGDFRAGQIVISFYHADQLGLKVGDTVTLDIPSMDPDIGFVMTEASLVVSGIQSNHLGYYGFIDLDTLQEETNLHGMANMAYLITVDSDEDTDLENMMITTPGVSSVTHISETENILEPYLNMIIGFLVMIGLISAGLTAAIVYNLFIINAEEKKRDYATMKTLGTSMRRLSYLILIEASFVTVFGVILGILGGYAMAAYMVFSAPQLEMFNMELVVSVTKVTMGTLVIVAVVFAVSWVTIRYIRKINIADVIRERSTG